ncbi:MAG: signal transduction histidine kinase [Phycisphaerales bacterium]
MLRWGNGVAEPPVVVSILGMMMPDNTNPTSRTTRVPPTSADAGPRATDRVTELAHELANLLDGSMRWLSLAADRLPAEGSDSEARQHIDHARTELRSMSAVVGAAMSPVPIGSPLHQPGVGISLGEAIDHAVEVARPNSSWIDVDFEINIATLAGQSSAGPLYSVILNGIINAVESIGRCREMDVDGVHGRITIDAGIIEEDDGRSLMIEICDDGEGLPEGPKGGAWVFEHGNSGKPGGTGLGLAIARRTTEEIGGTISITPRHEKRQNLERPGARLQIRLPLRGLGEDSIGKEGAD